MLRSHLPMSYDRLLHRDFSLSKVNGDTNFQPERDKSETLNTLVHLSTHTQSAKNSAQLTTNTVRGVCANLINQISTNSCDINELPRCRCPSVVQHPSTKVIRSA